MWSIVFVVHPLVIISNWLIMPLIHFVLVDPTIMIMYSVIWSSEFFSETQFSYWCVLRREWMGCWGLLGWLLLDITSDYGSFPKIPYVKRTRKLGHGFHSKLFSITKSDHQRFGVLLGQIVADMLDINSLGAVVTGTWKTCWERWDFIMKHGDWKAGWWWLEPWNGFWLSRNSWEWNNHPNWLSLHHFSEG